MKIRSLYIYMFLFLLANNVYAGRHEIARDEANRIVNARFAQFYSDEATRKQQEHEAMQREIIRASELERSLLGQLNANNNESIKTAEDLAAFFSAGDNPNTSDNLSSPVENNPLNNGSSSESMNISNAPRGIGVNIPSNTRGGMGSNKPHNMTGGNGLLNLGGGSNSEQVADISQAISDLQKIPNSEQLVADIASDLEKTSPETAEKLKQEYKNATIAANEGRIEKGLSTNKSLENKVKDKSKDEKNKDKRNVPTTNLAKQAKGEKLIASRNKNHFEYGGQHKGKGVFNAITKYDFSENQTYTIYTAKNRVTVIKLEKNEKIISAPILGDKSRWNLSSITNDFSTSQQMLTVKPIVAGVRTSLTIVTSSRIYLIELIAQEHNYMNLVSWSY